MMQPTLRPCRSPVSSLPGDISRGAPHGHLTIGQRNAQAQRGVSHTFREGARGSAGPQGRLGVKRLVEGGKLRQRLAKEPASGKHPPAVTPSFLLASVLGRARKLGAAPSRLLAPAVTPNSPTLPGESSFLPGSCGCRGPGAKIAFPLLFPFGPTSEQSRTSSRPCCSSTLRSTGPTVSPARRPAHVRPGLCCAPRGPGPALLTEGAGGGPGTVAGEEPTRRG